jgi:hypothetical protein
VTIRALSYLGSLAIQTPNFPSGQVTSARHDTLGLSLTVHALCMPLNEGRVESQRPE